MDKQTLNVAFATQKGGSGKTAITVLVASYLHYNCGCPLAVIDCDFRNTAFTKCGNGTAGRYWKTST